MAVTKGFLFDLDSLFDTRLSTLERIDKDAAGEVLFNGYFRRERDEFEGFDLEAYRKMYRERDIVTLANAEMTSIMVNLPDTLHAYMLDNTREGMTGTIKVYVNIYPYRLTADEIEEMKMCLHVILNGLYPIEILNAKPIDITAKWIEDNIIAYYCYDWMAWMEHAHVDLVKKRLDSFTLITPKLKALSEIEEEKVRNQFDQETKDLIDIGDEIPDLTPFKAVESTIRSTCCNMMFSEVREFCLYLPDEIDDVKVD